MLSHFTYIRALNLLLGVSLAATSFVLSYKHERQQIFQEFTSQVDAFASSLELELGRNIAVLNSFRSFHEAFPQVEQKGFSTFSRNAREYNDGVYGMKWVPRVLNENRAAFEAELKAKFGIPGITDVAESQEGSGHYSLSPVSDEYYPILMSDPEASKELPIGYDLASKIVTRTALETATSNDQAIASTPLTVMEEGKQKYIYLISLPLYDKSAESEEERWKELKGFIVGLYDIDTIFNGVLENAWNWSEANNIALDDNSGQVSGTSIRVSEHTGSDLVDDDRFVYSKQLSP